MIIKMGVRRAHRGRTCHERANLLLPENRSRFLLLLGDCQTTISKVIFLSSEYHLLHEALRDLSKAGSATPLTPQTLTYHQPCGLSFSALVNWSGLPDLLLTELETPQDTTLLHSSIHLQTSASTWHTVESIDTSCPDGSTNQGFASQCKVLLFKTEKLESKLSSNRNAFCLIRDTVFQIPWLMTSFHSLGKDSRHSWTDPKILPSPRLHVTQGEADCPSPRPAAVP